MKLHFYSLLQNLHSSSFQLPYTIPDMLIPNAVRSKIAQAAIKGSKIFSAKAANKGRGIFYDEGIAYISCF